VCREDREDFDLKAAEGNTGNQKRGRPEGSAGGGSGSGGRRVFVNNLAEETTWQSLKEYFKQAGAVAHADVLAVRALVPVHSSIRGIILPTCAFDVSKGCQQGGVELPQLPAEVS
jgi:RNA recognition motif-containing protein